MNKPISIRLNLLLHIERHAKQKLLYLVCLM